MACRVRWTGCLVDLTVRGLDSNPIRNGKQVDDARERRQQGRCEAILLLAHQRGSERDGHDEQRDLSTAIAMAVQI